MLDPKKFNQEIQKLPELLKSADVLSEAEMESIKQKVMLNIATPAVKAPVQLFVKERFKTLIRYIISVLLGLSLVGGTAFASVNAKPGDILYPVKRIREKVQLSIAVSEESKANLQAKFADERLKELQELSVKSLLKNKSEIGIQISATSSNLIFRGSVEPEDSVRINASHEAGKEVRNAISVLKEVRGKMEAKGDSRAAAVIGQNILKLETDAMAQDISSDDSDNNRNQGKSDIGHKPSSSSTEQMPNQGRGLGSDPQGINLDLKIENQNPTIKNTGESGSLVP